MAARKSNPGGKMINPNDPQENPDMFPAQAPPSRTGNAPEEPIGRRAVGPTTHESRASREDRDLRQFNEAPPRNDIVGHRQNRRGHGSESDHPVRNSAKSEYSVDRSPLHPQYQGKLAGKGSASPAWESKHSYDSSHGTHGRSRMKTASRGNASPDRGAVVPRFGDWSESNPASAENYTHIFDRVREEKISGSPMVSSITTDPSLTNIQKQNNRNKYKSRCFPCFRK